LQEPITGGTETILVVEDEPAVRQLAVEALQLCGYHVLEAESSLLANELFCNCADQIDLLLTDKEFILLTKPFSGPDLLRIVRQTRRWTRPETAVFSVTQDFQSSIRGQSAE